MVEIGKLYRSCFKSHSNQAEPYQAQLVIKTRSGVTHYKLLEFNEIILILNCYTSEINGYKYHKILYGNKVCYIGSRNTFKEVK